jgi:hypothetical protein
MEQFHRSRDLGEQNQRLSPPDFARYSEHCIRSTRLPAIREQELEFVQEIFRR